MFRLLKTISFAMLMQMMEERSAHERIDGLEKRMDERFDFVDAEFLRIDRRFEKMENEIRELRVDQKAGTQELRGEINKLRDGVESMQRTMLYGVITVSGIMATGFLTLAGLQIA